MQKTNKGRETVCFLTHPPHPSVWWQPRPCLTLHIHPCCCLVAKSFRFFVTPMDYSSPGSSVHGISQTRTGAGCHFLLQGIFSTQVFNPHLLLFCIGRWNLYHRATSEVWNSPIAVLNSLFKDLAFLMDFFLDILHHTHPPSNHSQIQQG